MFPQNPKVVFMGSPEFAIPSLDTIVNSQIYRPVAVVTQPDRGKGRGKKILPTPVKARALELGIPVLEMSKANYAGVVSDVADLEPDVIVVVAFGIIVRNDLLDLPPKGCVNIHPSLLPKYRGVSPIQAAILAGDSETGCTTMKMDAGVDTGGIYLQETIDVESDETAGTLGDRLAALGAVLLIRTLDGIFDGSVEPSPQDDSAASYTKKIEKKHGQIDWAKDASQVDRRIRAMTPAPGAYTFRHGRRLIVVEASVSDGGGQMPGTILSLDPFKVMCGDGALEIRRFKPEGKKAMTPAAYIAGNAVKAGDRFE